MTRSPKLHTTVTQTLHAAHLRCVLKDVPNDFHGRLRRENVGVPHHELLEDVILNGASQLLLFGSLQSKHHQGAAGSPVADYSTLNTEL